MRLLYLAYARLPTEKAHGAQIVKTCEAFAKEGASVQLMVPGRKTPFEEDAFAHYGVEENFTLTTLTTPDFTEYGPLGFVFSTLWFSEAAKLTRQFREADVVYSRDAFVLVQYLFLGRRLVYEAHTAPTVISRLVARHSHKLVVISEGLRDAYLALGVPEEKIVIAHDAVDVEAFSVPQEMAVSRNALDIPKNVRVALYVGRIDAAKGTETLAKASELLSKEIQVVFIGTGPLKETLSQQYPRALFLPETPYINLPQVLAAGDLLILPNSAHDENASRYTSPMKAFAYMASGVPIVASDVPALRNVLNEDTATFFVSDSPRSLADVISSALEDEQTFVKAQAARSAVRRYTWNERAKRILSHML